MIYAFSPEGVACLEAVLATDPLLAFDIDGTLAPIVERTDEARLPDDVQSCLAALAQRYLIGNHGAEGLPGSSSRSEEFARTVRSWRDSLAASRTLATAGVMLEDKRYSLSLHYRRAANPAAAHRAIQQSVERLAPVPRVIVGKAVVNLLPAGAPDKGEALRALIEQARCSNVLYVGDDDTDETVFGLNLPSVLTLRVEPAADSAAALFLRDQREVLTLLHHIARNEG